MRRRTLHEAASFALAAGLLSGCHDTCLLVVGCKDTDRIAVEGRVVTSGSGQAVPGTTLTLIANGPAAIESTKAVSDARGQFSLVLPAGSVAPMVLSLVVMPPGKPGYTISPLDCGPVSRWGDACVLTPIVSEPTFPLFVFLYRNDVSQAAANVRVTFARTGGATLFGPGSSTPLQVVTDAAGAANLFPFGVTAGGAGPVVGDLTVELPAPIGTTVRHNYRVQPNSQFNVPQYAVQLTGPKLEYIMVFSDSASGRRVAGVEVRYQRVSGVPTKTESFRALSDDIGRVFFGLTPLAQGTISGDFSITPPGSSVTTPMNGVSLSTFDADSSIVLTRLRVGVTGILYPTPPGGP